MRPIIGNSIVVPHIIKRVCIIEGVNITMVGMMRHLLLFAALHCSRGIIEYGGLMIFLGDGEKRGFGEEQRGFSGVKAPLQTQLYPFVRFRAHPFISSIFFKHWR